MSETVAAKRQLSEAEQLLVALHRAERRVHDFPEPKAGDAYDAKWKSWQRAYRLAVAAGARIEAEGR